MADQMIFKRCEIKYMLDITQAELLKNQMKQYMTADEHGMSTICSLYFDTPDYLLIQRSMEHPVYKEKLRLRSYGTADKDTTVFVELKKKYESVVYKRRNCNDGGRGRTLPAFSRKSKRHTDHQRNRLLSEKL